MPKLAAREPPPPDYYADNLRQLLVHVQRHYGDLLATDERHFIDSVLARSVGAGRLFARLLSRKGPWIRVDRLRYQEVDDLDAALAELQAGGLVEVNGPAPADALLGLLTQPERELLFPALGSGFSKQQMIAACVSRYPDRAIAQQIASHVPWLCVSRYQLFHRAQLLFFGDSRQDLTTFVLEDLGFLKFETYALSPDARQFSDRAAFDRYLRLLELASLSRRVEEHQGMAEAVVAELSGQDPDAQTRLEQRVHDGILNRLGQRFERLGATQSALACYKGSRRHPARERRVRLLAACDKTAAAEQLLCEMRAQPWSAQEQDFAERFQRRRRTQIPTTRMSLGGARVEHIEEHAVRCLAEAGNRAWHLENSFPLALTGLAYWPVIFAEVPGAFVNPFQAGPVDLHWEDFLQPRGRVLEAREAELEADTGAVLRETYAAKEGVTNRLVNWFAFTPDVLEATLAAIPPAQLRRLVRYVLANLTRTRVGFPDLLVIRGKGDYEFVEVKGPTDQLQPAQRIWFKALAKLDMPARVLKFTA